MAITDVSICNSALLKIGGDRIVTMNDTSKSAIICNEQYPKLRDEVLQAGTWHFALRRAVLAQTTAPAFGWAFAYQLPADYLEAIIDQDADDIEFAVEGKTLVTQESSFNLKYIAQVLDTSYFTPVFAEALALRMAADLAYPIANSTVLAKAMYDAYSQSIRQARFTNAKEGSSQRFSANEWLNRRR